MMVPGDKKEMHLRPHHLNPRSGILKTSMGTFVSPMCICIHKIRQKRVIFHVSTSFATVVVLLQVMFASTYPMGQELYEKSQFAKKATTVSAFFTRIIPPFCDVTLSMRISALILVLVIISFLSIIWTFATFHPTSLFSPEDPVFQPFYGILVLRLLHLPTVSLTVYYFFNSENVTIPIISTLVCLVTLIGCQFYEWFLYGVPNLSYELGIRWSSKQFLLRSIFQIIIVGASELMPYINQQWEQFLAVGVNIVICLIVAIYTGVNMPGMSLLQNSLTLFVHINCVIITIIYIFCILLLQYPGLYNIIILVLSIPVLLLANRIAVSRTKDLLRICNYTIDTDNYDLLNNFSHDRLISLLGHCLHDIDYQPRLFEYAVERFPDSFEILSFHAKVVAFLLKDWSKLDEIITQILSLKSLKFLQQVTTVFFELISLQEETQRNSTQLNEMCSLSTDEYLRSLNMFWAEVLLGRPERVFSLANVVYKKYQTALSLYSFIGTNGKSNKNYERFCSISTVKLNNQLFQADNSIQSAFDANTDEYLMQDNLRRKDRNFEYQPPLKSVHIAAHMNKYQRRIHIYRSLIFFLPLACVLIFTVLDLYFAGDYPTHLQPTWDLFYQLEQSGINIANMYMLFPYIYLNIDSDLTKNSITDVLMDLTLYPSGMKNPVGDFNIAIKKVEEEAPIFLEKLGSFKYQQFVSSLKNLDFTILLDLLSNAPIKENVTFSQYIHMLPINFKQIYNIHNDTSKLYSLFNSSNIIVLTENLNSFLYSMSEFASTFPVQIKSFLYKERQKAAKKYGIAIACTSVIVFLLIVLFLNLYNRNVDKLFEPLFALPKVAISELLEKLEDKPRSGLNEQQTNEQADSQIAYNLMQLSCDQPPQLYPTIFKSKVYTSIIIAIIFVIYAVMLYPIANELLVDTKKLLDGLEEAKNGYIIPIQLMSIGTYIFEICLRIRKGLTQYPENRKQFLMENVYDLAKYIQDNLGNLAVSVMKFTEIIETEYYIGIKCTKGSHPFKCLSFLDRLSDIYTQTYQVLDNISQTKYNAKQVDYLLGLLFSGITSQTPKLNKLTYENAKLMMDNMLNKAILYVLLFIVVIFIVYSISQFYESMLDIPHNFALPVLASIPPASLTTFHTFLGATENEDEIDKDNSETIKQLFQEESTFSTLIDNILLLSQDNRIISATPEVITLFELDSFDFVGMNIMDFLHKVAVGFSYEPTLPPTRSEQFDFMRQHSDGYQILIMCTLTPVPKFTSNGTTVFYVCLFDDVTRLNMLISQLNYEANHVRLLTAQFVQHPALPAFLDGSDFQTLIFSKVVVGTVYISSSILHPNLLIQIMDVVRKSCNLYPNLSWFGRTIQAFRVVSGLTDKILSPTECATEVVSFALSLLSSIKELEKTLLDTQIDMKCGIHLSGPFFGDIISEMPPLFDLLGGSMSISSQIASYAAPNHVCISRDVYEAIFDQGFKITFDNEISQIGGEAMSVHNVEYQK